jgi:hypothetical protein
MQLPQIIKRTANRAPIAAPGQFLEHCPALDEITTPLCVRPNEFSNPGYLNFQRHDLPSPNPL